MFWRVMRFEAFDQVPSLGGWKGFVERCGLDEDDRRGLREVNVGQVFVGVIDGGAAVGDLGVAPALERPNIMNRLATPLRVYS